MNQPGDHPGDRYVHPEADRIGEREAGRAIELADDAAFWLDTPDDEHTLVDLVNRLLDKGVVITGDVTISVAGVDLVYLGLNAVLASVATARAQLGRPRPAEP